MSRGSLRAVNAGAELDDVEQDLEVDLVLGVAAGGALGILIPPSIMLIIYGILTNESVGGLFIAGIIPGVLLTINYSIAITVMALLFLAACGAPAPTEAPPAAGCWT